MDSFQISMKVKEEKVEKEEEEEDKNIKDNKEEKKEEKQGEHSDIKNEIIKENEEIKVKNNEEMKNEENQKINNEDKKVQEITEKKDENEEENNDKEKEDNKDIEINEKKEKKEETQEKINEVIEEKKDDNDEIKEEKKEEILQGKKEEVLEIKKEEILKEKKEEVLEDKKEELLEEKDKKENNNIIEEQKEDDKNEKEEKEDNIIIKEQKENDKKEEEKEVENEQIIEEKQENEIVEQKEENINDNKIIEEKKIQENPEKINLKLKQDKTDFETHIIRAYKKLIGQATSQDNLSTNQNNKQENQIIENSENILSVKNCEQEIRLALNSCIETKIIILNNNILDKMGRIIRHNKMNLIFIIGQIYINLMSKDYLFNPLNKSINLELLIFFCNEVISLNSLLKQTYLGNKFNQTLINFIIKIMNDYTFEKDQLTVMKEILETHNINTKPIKLNISGFDNMVKNINETLNEQETFYDQYKFLFDNSENIVKMINSSDVINQDDANKLNNYLELGKIFSYLLFNKKYVIYLRHQSHENEIQGVTKTLFNGYEDNIHINAIEDEKFYIDIDEDIEIMRENLCNLIIKYVEKYIVIKNLFEFQYVLYVLIKRIYFHFHEKYKDKIDPLLAEVIINLCYFKEDTIEEVKLFINEILKSEKEKDSNLKKLIHEKIELNKSNPDFNYAIESEEHSKDQIDNYFTNITNISIETLSLSQSDLRIGFFTKKVIKAGEIFTFYVELSEPYGILDFCLVLDDYDIKLRIKNLTEGREVYNENELTIFHCPFKLMMFFTKPGIFQFEIDNSYSWLRSKTIRYKVNKFYPLKTYYVERKIILMKYQEIIYNRKKMSSINYNNNDNLANKKEKIFLVKFNGENNSFNCEDTTLNMEISNKMGRDNYIKVSSIYIDSNIKEKKSYFYVKNNENNSLIEYELNKTNFMEYINNEIVQKSKVNIDIINLYLITDNDNIIDNHYISIEEILGFEPNIKSNESHCKILFFLQYLHQAQMIYYLFSKINNDEKIQNVILINYTTYSGYQICMYKNGEIFLKFENLGIKKDENLEKNMEIIAKKIKEMETDEKIEILVAENINENDKDINAEKIGDELIKKMGMNLEEEGNFKVIYLNKDFNKEVNLNSHIFYLDE